MRLSPSVYLGSNKGSDERSTGSALIDVWVPRVVFSILLTLFPPIPEQNTLATLPSQSGNLQLDIHSWNSKPADIALISTRRLVQICLYGFIILVDTAPLCSEYLVIKLRLPHSPASFEVYT